MDVVANYQLACQSSQAMVQDYHAGYPPFVDAAAAIPLVPLDGDDGEPLVEDPPFEYVELRIADKNYLAVLTPFEVKGGPGPKYSVTKVG